MAKSTSARTNNGLHIQVQSVETTPEEPTRIRRGYYAEDCDDRARDIVKEHFGCSTDSDAVCLALHLVAEAAITYRLDPKTTRRVLARFR